MKLHNLVLVSQHFSHLLLVNLSTFLLPIEFITHNLMSKVKDNYLTKYIKTSKFYIISNVIQFLFLLIIPKIDQMSSIVFYIFVIFMILLTLLDNISSVIMSTSLHEYVHHLDPIALTSNNNDFKDEKLNKDYDKELIKLINDNPYILSEVYSVLSCFFLNILPSFLIYNSIENVGCVVISAISLGYNIVFYKLYSGRIIESDKLKLKHDHHDNHHEQHHDHHE